MDIALLFVPILMWSFVGILVKEASAAFAPALVAFFRFAFGVVFLGVWFAIRRRRPALAFAEKWVWIGAAAKTINYAAENVAMARGASWGYVVEQPIQAVALVAISVLYFREKTGKRKLFAAFLCVVGASLFAVRGLSRSGAIGPENYLLFAVAALGAAVHFASQKALAGRLASADMNLSVFLAASLLSGLLLPFSGTLLLGPVGAVPVFSAVTLGVVTGSSFLIWAAVASRVPFLVSSILTNSLAIFALAWGVLLRGERVDAWSIAGTVVFIAGLLAMNLRGGSAQAPRPKA